MLATQVISEVQRLGASITVEDTGENLVIDPGSLLTPELIDELRHHKEGILKILRDEVQRDTSKKVASVGEVLELARNVLPELKEEDRVDLDELIQANSPPPPGRDPLVHRDTEKGRFFKGDWRQTWPRDFKVYEGGKS
jgi:chromatin segregation and condensation protein Rec8/ScpA/Scc1 (kleisin family)